MSIFMLNMEDTAGLPRCGRVLRAIPGRALRLALASALAFNGFPGGPWAPEAQAQTSGWLAGWTYRKALVIENTGAALSDYQVKVTNPVYDETGLVGSWHFEEAAGTVSGTAADFSGSGNNGTLTNMAGPNGIVSAGKFGNGASFDGADDSVRVADSGSLDLTSEMTVEAWIYPTAFASGGTIIVGKHSSASPGTGYNFFIYPVTNKASLQFGDGAAAWPYANTQSNTALSLNTWSHVVATRSGTQIKFYLNGQPDGTTTVGSNNIAANTRDLWIGDNVDVPAGGYQFNGSIDEVKIYNRALSAAEIQAHFQAKAKPNYGDVRFTKSDGITEINAASGGGYWMEKDGTFWVKVPGTNIIPANGNYTMYMYYGNASAVSASSGASTFINFSDFSDLSGWTQDAGVWTVSNGLLASGSSAGYNYLRYNTPAPSSPYILSTRFKQASSASDRMMLAESNNPLDRTAATQLTLRTSDGALFCTDDEGTWTNSATNPTAVANAWYTANLQIKAGDNKCTLLAGQQIGSTAQTLDSAGTGHFFGFVVHNSDASYNIDWILVRKYAPSEPAVSVYAEQKDFAFTYRRAVTVNNTGNASTLYNYQVGPITVDTSDAARFNADCSALRFTDAAAGWGEGSWDVSYPYWIESGCGTASTKIWVKVPSIAASAQKTIYLYYGNLSAVSAGSGADTFEFFDDFSGDLSKWVNNYPARISIVSGELKQTQAAGTGSQLNDIYTINTFSPQNSVLEYKVSIQGTQTDAWYIGWRGDGTANNRYYISFNPYVASSEVSIGATVGGASSAGASAGTSHLTGAYYNFKAYISGNTFYTNTELTSSSETDAKYTQITSANVGLSDWADTLSAYYDNIRVRKYASPEPAVSSGGEAEPQTDDLFFLFE